MRKRKRWIDGKGVGWKGREGRVRYERGRKGEEGRAKSRKK